MQRTSSLFLILCLFLLTGPASAQLNDAVKFRITDPNGHSDEMIVRFENTATTLVDPDWDAWKWFGMNPANPSIYSWSSEPYELAVNSIPFPNRDTTMAIMMNAYETGGTYMIEALFEGTFTSELKMGIKDLVTGQRYTVTNNMTFLFDVVPGPDEMERFSLFISPATHLNIDENNVAVINNGATDWNCKLFFNGGPEITSHAVPADSTLLASLVNESYMIVSTDTFGLADTLYFAIDVESEEEPNTASIIASGTSEVAAACTNGILTITGNGMVEATSSVYFFSVSGQEIFSPQTVSGKDFETTVDLAHVPAQLIIVVLVSGDRKYDFKLALQ